MVVVKSARDLARRACLLCRSVALSLSSVSECGRGRLSVTRLASLGAFLFFFVFFCFWRRRRCGRGEACELRIANCELLIANG